MKTMLCKESDPNQHEYLHFSQSNRNANALKQLVLMRFFSQPNKDRNEDWNERPICVIAIFRIT